MGLATTGGILFAISPLGFLVAFALVLICVLVIRHSARGVVVAAVTGPFVYWLLDLIQQKFGLGQRLPWLS